MKFSALKELVKKNGDRFVLMENDEPQIVMLSFDEYARMANHMPVSSQSDSPRFPMPQRQDNPIPNLQTPDPGLINAEFDVRTNMPAQDDITLSGGRDKIDIPTKTKGLPLRLEDLRLEDLPL